MNRESTVLVEESNRIEKVLIENQKRLRSSAAAFNTTVWQELVRQAALIRLLKEDVNKRFSNLNANSFSGVVGKSWCHSCVEDTVDMDDVCTICNCAKTFKKKVQS